ATPPLPLFPSTTLFRSRRLRHLQGGGAGQLVAAALDEVGEGVVRVQVALEGRGRRRRGGPGRGRGRLGPADRAHGQADAGRAARSEEHTSELQSRENLV